MNNFGDVRQIAYLTDDIQTSMKAWSSRSGVGPFTWYKNLKIPMVHKYENSIVEMEVGIAYRGNLQIELIQQTNNAPSPYREFFNTGRMGLHHLAFITEDIDADIKKAEAVGFEIITTIDAITGRYAYFQDSAMPENYFEFLQGTPDLNKYWQQCIEEAKSWDGKNPIRAINMKGL